MVATEASSVWVIDRKNFKDVLMKVSEEKIEEYVKYLNRVEILSSLLAAEKLQVAKALMEVHFSKDEAGHSRKRMRLLYKTHTHYIIIYICVCKLLEIRFKSRGKTSWQVIIRQGDAGAWAQGISRSKQLRGTTFYILFEGEVAVSVDGDEPLCFHA